MPWAMFSYLLGHSEDCQECRTYWFLHALSNLFLPFWSLQGLPGVENILVFICFEQCFPIFEVTRRTARSTEYIDFYMPWAMFSYLLGYSEDYQECRIYWFLYALSNAFLSFRLLQGLPGVQNILIFICLEQCFPVFSVTPRTARSAEHIDFYMP